jgi:hypothetical protein
MGAPAFTTMSVTIFSRLDSSSIERPAQIESGRTGQAAQGDPTRLSRDFAGCSISLDDSAENPFPLPCMLRCHPNLLADLELL